jgi:hypothetical protein
MCETHWAEMMRGQHMKFLYCEDCNICMCGFTLQEGFGTHLLCNKPGGMHSYCFKGKDDENPYKKNDPNYYVNTWICPKHRGEKSNDQK